MLVFLPTFRAVATFSVIFCAAVNCYTYQIAYPLWRSVGSLEFRALHAAYLHRLTWIITIPHIVMFVSTLLLTIYPPASHQRAMPIILFILAALVIIISAFVAGPVHSRFERRGILDEAGMTLLIRVSAARAVLMLAASVIVLVLPTTQP